MEKIEYEVKVHFPREWDGSSNFDALVRETGTAAGGKMSARLHSWLQTHIYLGITFKTMDKAVAFAQRWHSWSSKPLVFCEIEVDGWQDPEAEDEAAA